MAKVNHADTGRLRTLRARRQHASRRRITALTLGGAPARVAAPGSPFSPSPFSPSRLRPSSASPHAPFHGKERVAFGVLEKLRRLRRRQRMSQQIAGQRRRLCRVQRRQRHFVQQILARQRHPQRLQRMILLDLLARTVASTSSGALRFVWSRKCSQSSVSRSHHCASSSRSSRGALRLCFRSPRRVCPGSAPGRNAGAATPRSSGRVRAGQADRPSLRAAAARSRCARCPPVVARSLQVGLRSHSATGA